MDTICPLPGVHSKRMFRGLVRQDFKLRHYPGVGRRITWSSGPARAIAASHCRQPLPRSGMGPYGRALAEVWKDPGNMKVLILGGAGLMGAGTVRDLLSDRKSVV